MDDVTVEYRLPGQGCLSGPLSQVWNVRYEDADPVVAAPKGMPEWAFSKTPGRSVHYRSEGERELLMRLDFDNDVVAVAWRPFRLGWRADLGSPRQHYVPTYFARLAEGTGVVIDVRGTGRRAGKVPAFAVLDRVFGGVGWRYERPARLDSVLAANLRWLTGYRAPYCDVPVIAEALRYCFRSPMGLLAGVERAGSRVAVLPVAFHLLWKGQLVADPGLDEALLDMATTVRAVI